MAEHIDAWRKLLNREQLVSELVATSLFVLVWELLCDCVIDQVRSFFLLGSDDESLAKEYQQKVLVRHRSHLQASLLWLQDLRAVDQGDIDLVATLLKHRNDVVHELPKRLYSAMPAVDVSLVEAAMKLIAKIDTWFIREVEVPTNPDIEPDNVDMDGVASGRMIILQTMLEVLSGNEKLVAEVQQVLVNPEEFLE